MPDREYFNTRRKNRRERFINLLGGKCERCGGTENLQFDHQHPNKKDFRIADRIDAPENILLKEVMKCILMCASCHRNKTREKGEHGQPKARHGTLWMYKGYGCRCTKCKQNMSNYNKERRISFAELDKIIDGLLKQATNSMTELDNIKNETLSLLVAISRLTEIESSHAKIDAALIKLASFMKRKDWDNAFDSLREAGQLVSNEYHYLIIKVARALVKMRSISRSRWRKSSRTH